MPNSSTIVLAYACISAIFRVAVPTKAAVTVGAMVGLQIFARPRVPQTVAKEGQTETAPRGQPSQTEVVVRVSSGRWAGDHKAVVLQKGRTQSTRKKLTAIEELQQLQGMWELKELVSKGSKERLPADKAEAKIYVRGKRVEESTADGHRRFFNLVLAEKAHDPACMERASKEGCARGTKRPRREDLDRDRRDKRHALPPLQGPCTLENVKNVGQKAAKAKGKGKQAGKTHAPGHWMLLHHTPKLLILRDGVSAQDPLWWHPDEQAAWSRGGHSEESLTIRYTKDEHTEKLLRHSHDPPNTWRTSKGVAVMVLAAKSKSKHG